MNSMMMNNWMNIGMIATGVVILYVIYRRKFNRRTLAGLEAFRSFEAGLLTRLLEGLLQILAWALILAGGFFLVMA